MRKFVLLILVLFLNQNLHSQNEVVGQVEFYKSNASLDPAFQSSTDKQIMKLNSQKHQISVRQRGKTQKVSTDSLGLFWISIFPTDTIFIEVNKGSKILNSSFVLHPTSNTDTLKLKISDKNLVRYKDSIVAPEFFKEYNEQQAVEDFENGSLRLLAVGGEITKEEKTKQEVFTEKYKVTFEYPLFGSMQSQSELRIMQRYNQKMEELIGIKNVW
jgi:hypothetical protein